MDKLTAEDRITRAKVQLQDKSPFFSYLISHLRLHESNAVPTMGVNAKGDLYYNPEFVAGLSESELEAVLCHETVHVAFEHADVSRVGLKHKEKWNIAADMITNNILLQNKFALPKCGIIPQNGEIELFGVKITEIDGKTAEDIYDLLPNPPEGETISIFLKGDLKCDEESAKGAGEAEQSGNKGGVGDVSIEIDAKDWKKILSEAVIYSETRGTKTSGIKREYENAYSKINWRTKLAKFVSSQIPHDYSYLRRSKASIASGYFMPDVQREFLEVALAIDTSGSIDNKVFAEFAAEIIGIAKAYSNFKINVIVCDCEVKETYSLSNGNIAKFKNLKFSGGGGTSHVPVFDYFKKNLRNVRALICFTDGFTEFPETAPIGARVLWVLTDGNNKEEAAKTGEVLVLR